MKDLHRTGAGALTSPVNAAVLTEAQAIEHLKHCRELTRTFAYRVFPGFWRHWCRLVGEHADEASSNQDQLTLLEIQRLLLAVQHAAEQEFAQHLGNAFVKFKNKALHIPKGEERFGGDKLTLVAHADLEESIAISSIVHRAEALHAETLWALQARLALLNDGEKIDERSNPVGPLQFCEALRRVLDSMDVDIKTKVIGYKTFEMDVIRLLDELYEELNRYLVEHQLLPNLRMVIHKAGEVSTEGAPQRRASDGILNGSLNPGDVQYQASLLSAIRLLQAHADQQRAIQPGASSVEGQVVLASEALQGETHPASSQSLAGAQVLDNTQLVQILQDLQIRTLQLTQQHPEHDAHNVPSVEAGRRMLEQITQQHQQGAVSLADMQTIDLVGMLFEYMLSDDNLPDTVKTLLSYLHTPFLKIAFIDKDFFEQPEHPARALMNSLAEAGARWVSNDGKDQHDIYLKIKATVFQLLKEFKNDVAIFSELLLKFNTYTNNLVRRQALMERRVLEKVQGEEKLREAKVRVNQEVRKRIDQRAVPSALLLLLLQPWSDFLSFVLLRYGDATAHWKRALQVVDELLWSIQPKTLQADKNRLLKLQGPLTAALERGFETIGYDQSKGRKLVEAIAHLQKMALQSRQAQPASEPMRSKLENMAAEKAGGSVVAELPVTAEEEKIVESLKMIEYGTWFEFQGGRRLKVAWYNKKTQHYMLVDQQGKKVTLSAGLELAREMLAGRAKIIIGSTKPFFERALENIYQTLNERADQAQTNSEAVNE